MYANHFLVCSSSKKTGIKPVLFLYFYSVFMHTFTRMCNMYLYIFNVCVSEFEFSSTPGFFKYI